MSDQHDLCRQELKAARTHYKQSRIPIPKHITALRTQVVTRTEWFIEADGVRGEFVRGCCAFDAKARYIHDIVNGTIALQNKVERPVPDAYKK